MEEKNKERYEAPEVVVVELKMDGHILQFSSEDYPGNEI